jgi:hypothetical protein
MKFTIKLSGVVDDGVQPKNLWIIEGENGFRKELLLPPLVTLDQLVSRVQSKLLAVDTSPAPSQQTEAEVDLT